MTIINLYIIDMSHVSNTSGVDRYVNTLIYALYHFPEVKVHWINLLYDNKLLFPKEEQINHYIKYTIPLPQQYNSIISEKFWIRKYNEQIYRLTKHLFEGNENCIIHLQTLNLIDLGIFIREQTGCKIITHLHCIPWKGLYNSDKKKFNVLYKLSYIEKKKKKDFNPEIYVTNYCELQSYTAPDALLCVTHCAVDFLKNSILNFCENIHVIPNGINDLNCYGVRQTSKTKDDIFRCLFVGAVSESKGVMYIIKALNLLHQRGYKVSLTIAGICNHIFMLKIKQDYPYLEIDIKGRIPFDELKKLYSESDIGIIASLQEQASYVAIEMAMFGLPIVTTAVDGLDEIFTDEVNALKVNTTFSSIFGLSVDVEMMAMKIIRLIDDESLRNRLSQNVRKLYEQELNLEQMIKKTVSVYKSLII
ncbi:MAG: glycosyltransferase family 4 protein [Fermentimonas sp.]|nr:glycosyltransferase family 4 protein [Fermentimonas sp.]